MQPTTSKLAMVLHDYRHAKSPEVISPQPRRRRESPGRCPEIPKRAPPAPRQGRLTLGSPRKRSPMKLPDIKPGDQLTWLHEQRGGYGFITPVHVTVRSIGRVKVCVEAPLARGGTKPVSVSPDKLRPRVENSPAVQRDHRTSPP